MEADLRPPVTAPAISPRYKWWVVGMLWFICFFNYADRQAVYSVFPKLRQEFGFDPFQLGLIASAFTWIYAAGAPVAGFIGDWLRRKTLILGGCLFWSAITVATAWCGQFWHFVTVRAMEGLGETFYFPASMSMISDYHSARTRSRAMSIHQSSVYVGTILGSWWGAWFAEHHGWRTGFYFFGLLGVLLVLALARFLREPVRGQAETADALPESRSSGRESAHASTERDQSRLPSAATSGSSAGVVNRPAPAAAPPTVREVLAEIFRTPTAWVLLGVFVGANFVATIFLTWTPTFLVEKFNFKLTAAGLNGSIFIHLASALSVPLGGALADRWARRFAGGRMLVQALGLLVGAGFVFVVGMTRNVHALIGAMAVFGFCKGLYDANIFASVYDVVAPRARATAAGVMNFVGWGGGGLGPVVFGWLAQHGRYGNEVANMSHAIAFGAIVYLVGAALLLVAILFFAPRDVGREARA
ncbi:MAG: MFS transporter [Verrucomicrobia bacterium]|nr:MFS transporter [Verrucomicrobiota bacterium]